MKRILALGVLSGLALAAGSGANAATRASIEPPDAGLTIAVSGGCGPYGHRDYYGYCWPNQPPPVYYRRACPWGTHPTPYGCRPNY